DVRVLREPRVGEVRDDRPEEERRDLEVEDRRGGAAHRVADALVRRPVVEVAGHVGQALGEAGEDLGVDVLAGVLDARLRVLAELVDAPVAAGHADDRAVEQAARLQAVQRAERHDLRQVPSDPEDHEDVGGLAHAPVAGFSACPPNAARIADIALFANRSRSREAKREYRAVVSTGAGTPSSIAASAVQRPSPESDTRPAYSSRSGEAARACAARSSSQEAMTLPLRQTSETAARSNS